MELKFEISKNETIVDRLTIDTSNIAIKTTSITKGGSTFNRYEVEITDEIRKFCWSFASRIILSNNQYNRLNPTWANSNKLKDRIRIQRSYAGKLGEVAFLILLVSKEKSVDYSDMFKIYNGQENTDRYDFITNENKTIDVKAAFRDIHKNLVVNSNQLENIPKDYYVGVKLDAKDCDYKNKVINNNSITSCIIYGYAEREYLEGLNNKNFGEGLCKGVSLENLLGIDRLLNKFN